MNCLLFGNYKTLLYFVFVCFCNIGSSQINGRLNYSNRTTQTFRGTIFLNCNDIPTIEPLDEAIKDRLRIFKFLSRFVLDPSQVNATKGIYLRLSKFRDPSFIKTYGISLFHILMDYLTIYIR